jgi:hypothetical protein
MATVAASRGAASPATRSPQAVIPLLSWPYVVSGMAAVSAIAAGGLTLFVPNVLRGPAAMNGSGRGTAAVALFVAVPVLAASIYAVSRGMVRPVITWLGATAFLLYNSVLLLFITPFNQLFLFYVAMFALSFWSIVGVLRSMGVQAFADRYSPRLPARRLAAYIGVVGLLNGLAWLGDVGPAVLSTKSPAWLVGTGNTTNPIYVQDLSFWVPLMIISAVWLWRRRPWGMVLGGALLVFGFIESISIAVDQWMGSAADPSSQVVSAGFTPIFGVVAAVQLVATFFYFRHLNQR